MVEVKIQIKVKVEVKDVITIEPNKTHLIVKLRFVVWLCKEDEEVTSDA